MTQYEKREQDGTSVLSRLPPNITNVLERARVFRHPLYLVGGTVRDALLPLYVTGQSQPDSRDLDLVTEGDAKELGQTLQEVFGGDLTCHAEFMTCTLNLPDLTVDIATAREEVYPSPGALPQVRRSSLERDLFRRDFTLNALAVRVSPQPVLIDLFEGLEDLKHKQLRTLHAASFTDDPTRILRGTRLAGRLGFTFHPDTAEEMAAALEAGAADTVSAARLKNELLLTLAEPQVAPALDLMTRYDVLRAMFGLHANHDLIVQLDEQRREGGVPDESYLLALLMGVPEDTLAEQVATFGWSKPLLAKRRMLLDAEQTPVTQFLVANERALDPSVRAVLRALNPDFKERLERLERPKLSGKDVLGLGLSEGPEVGNVLAEIARARADGRVDSFEAELDLAKELVERFAHATKDDSIETTQETS